MQNTGRADLHIHTNVSDGFLSPAKILVKLKNSGISTIAITDHDSVAALDNANRRSSMFNIRLIPGVELSAEYHGKDLHFLGYFIDHHNKRFLDFLYLFRRRRYQRAQGMLEKLDKLGMHITMDQVAAIAFNGPIGRPHIADALINAGWADSRDDAFEKYLGYNGPVYVEKYRITPLEVFDLIHSIGGAAFLAHPGTGCSDGAIRELHGAGMDGLEIIHPKHTPEMVEHYKSLADELSILTCGGSDFHGSPDEEDVIGKYTIDEKSVDGIEKYCLSKRKEWRVDVKDYPD
ncbi:hypothetical protein AMJ80_10500 [bacterium SM23_31]|nr:MAG: hypothetical protein AMJ80_10500 [bacterium SM23_31]